MTVQTDLSLRGLIVPFLGLSEDEQFFCIRDVREDRLIRKRLPKRAKAKPSTAKRMPKKERTQLAALLKCFDSMTADQLKQLQQEFG